MNTPYTTECELCHDEFSKVFVYADQAFCSKCVARLEKTEAGERLPEVLQAACKEIQEAAHYQEQGEDAR